MKKLFLIILLFVSIIACNNDDDHNSFPSTLVETEYRIISDIQYYSKDGQITDQNAITRYIENYNKVPLEFYKNCIEAGQNEETCESRLNNSLFQKKFYLNKDTVQIQINDPKKIIYESNDSIRLWSNSAFDTTNNTRIPIRKGDYLYLYYKDTISGFCIYDMTFEEIQKELGQFKAYSSNNTPSSLNLNYCKTYSAAIATGDTHRLEFPMFSYSITRYNENNYSGIYRKNYNNIFNENVTRFLTEEDTLVIQKTVSVFIKE